MKFFACFVLFAGLVAQEDDGSTLEPGVNISSPKSVPKFYRKKIGDLFLDDFGGGTFSQNWQVSKNPKDLKPRFHVFVDFNVDMKNPNCRYMVQRQWSKTYRFIKQGGPFRRHPSTDGKEEKDFPYTKSGNDFQEAGEVVAAGDGFHSYDIPGMSIFESGMPTTVTADRIRIIFKAQIVCVPGGPVKTFYWMVELTLPYRDGLPIPKDGTGKAKQITEKDYKNAEKLFGQNHKK